MKCVFIRKPYGNYFNIFNARWVDSYLQNVNIMVQFYPIVIKIRLYEIISKTVPGKEIFAYVIAWTI